MPTREELVELILANGTIEEAQANGFRQKHRKVADLLALLELADTDATVQPHSGLRFTKQISPGFQEH